MAETVLRQENLQLFVANHLWEERDEKGIPMHMSLPLPGREEVGVTIQRGYVQRVDRADVFHLAFCEQVVKTKM